MDILLVEDSAPMRKLAATIVKRMGVEALELLQSSKVDLVLTDWSMPVVRVDVFLGHVPAKPTDNIPGALARRAPWGNTSQKLNSAAQKLTDE